MAILKRLFGLVLLFVFLPWTVFWLVMGLPAMIIFGDEGIQTTWWLAYWPYEKWIRNLLLA